jgi:nucleoside-diphosphate-sugar epimerase
MMIYLVTGGAGHLGSRVVKLLDSLGKKVRVLDDFSTGERSRIAGTKAEIMKASLSDAAAVRKALKGVGAVIHCATSYSDSIYEMEKTNCHGILTLLEECHKQNTRKLVNCSTHLVYGDNPKKRRTEDLWPMPTTPLGLTKMQAEYYCRAYSSIHKLQTVSLRFFDIYTDAKVPMTTASRDKAVHDFVHIDDCAKAAVIACKGKHFGESFNIGSGKPLTIVQAAKRLGKSLPKPKASGQDSYASLSKAKTIGYKPTRTL